VKLEKEKLSDPDPITSIKSQWPIFLTYSIASLLYSAIIINMGKISSEIWIGDPLEDHLFEISLILGARNVMWAISGLLFGTLADRVSRKYLFMVAALVVATSCLLFSRTPTGLGEGLFYYFLGANALSGLGLGAFRPIVNSFTNDILQKSQRSQFFGIYSGLNLTLMPVGMILAAFSFRWRRWRSFFGISGTAILFSIIFLYFFLKEPVRGQISSEKLYHALKATNTSYNYKMNKYTFKKTILSKSNILTIIEGIFTCIVFDILLFLIIPYLKGHPLNIDESNISIIFIIFAAPGAIISSTYLAKLSDRWGKKDIKNRITILIVGVFITMISLYIAFLIPLGEFTVEQGKDLLFLLSNPKIYIIGILITLILLCRVLYLANQKPVIQEINLPETQGFVSSLNQFIEVLASAIAPIFGGFVYSLTGSYLTTALICGSFAIPSIIMWIWTQKVIDKDIKQVQDILQERAEEMLENHKKSLEQNNN
jgi:MFS family permease